jgi:large subunit ribosomal protein L6
MKKKFFKEIEIPEGVEVEIKGKQITIKGEKGELSKEFKMNNLVFEKKDKKIVLGNEKATKKEKKMTNTIIAHIKNMLKGVQNKHEYLLKVCNSHFPMTVEIKGNTAIIKNFLGEKIPRECKIPEGVEVKVNKDVIVITSLDKELAGQAAANFEKTTKIRLKDRRIFQDGIYITNKAGREI